MRIVNYIKLVGLILGVAVLNIILFSPGLIGLRLGAGALSSAIGATLLAASGLTLLYGSYSLLFRAPPEKPRPVKQVMTHQDYVDGLTQYRRIKALRSDMDWGLRQLERLVKKKDTLVESLNQRFDPGELSYKKFASVIVEVENVFYLNFKSILNRLRAFDEAEYESVTGRKPPPLSPQLLQERKNIYNDYLSFTNSSLATNEEILLKLDKLTLEISRLDSLDPGEIEQLPCMQEIDTLIKQTKYYKN